MTLSKSNSSYGNWCVTYRGKYTLEHKFFWKKADAEKWIAENEQ